MNIQTRSYLQYILQAKGVIHKRISKPLIHKYKLCHFMTVSNAKTQTLEYICNMCVTPIAQPPHHALVLRFQFFSSSWRQQEFFSLIVNLSKPHSPQPTLTRGVFRKRSFMPLSFICQYRLSFTLFAYSAYLATLLLAGIQKI